MSGPDPQAPLPAPSLAMPQDGGRYRREEDGSLTRLPENDDAIATPAKPTKKKEA